MDPDIVDAAKTSNVNRIRTLLDANVDVDCRGEYNAVCVHVDVDVDGDGDGDISLSLYLPLSLSLSLSRHHYIGHPIKVMMK